MTAMQLSACLAVPAVIFYVTAFVLSSMYCTAGFLGYADVWRNRKAERAYYVLAPVSLALLIAAAVAAVVGSC